MKNYILIIIVFLFIFSCKNDKNSKNEITKNKVFSFFKQKGFSKEELSKLKAIIIFSNAGCGGCLSTGEQFLIDNDFNINNNSTLAIFTDISDLKKLSIRFKSSKILESKYVFIDKNNELTDYGFDSFYPIILFLNHGSIIKIERQTPNTFAFDNLKNHLNN